MFDMKIIRCSRFPPKGYSAIMLVWWLIVKKGATITTRIINHEKIHQKQQFEMFIVFFLPVVWNRVCHPLPLPILELEQSLPQHFIRARGLYKRRQYQLSVEPQSVRMVQLSKEQKL